MALPWLGDACGHCRSCVAGWETYCTSPQYMGYTMDGSYAEYAVGNASHVVRVPDGVTSFDAAPLTCAGVTTYKALKVAHPQPGETAMVVGIGGLGHLGLQYAKIFGTTTVAVDVDDAKLRWPRISEPTTSWTPAVTRPPTWQPSEASTSPW